MSSYGFPDGQEITQWLGQPIDEQTAYALGAGSKAIGPAVLANFASIIVAVKPTGGPVTVTITQGINGGPPGLQLQESVVVPAGATLFEAVVLFADSVTVTLQGSVGGTTVDYAVYPSNTTTNTQVLTQATVDIQHNDVRIAAEPALDFEDGASVAWTLADDAANSRMKITPQLVAGLNEYAEGGAGVQAIPNGLTTTLAAIGQNAAAGGLAVAAGVITIPAGAGGIYAVSVFGQWQVVAGGVRALIAVASAVPYGPATWDEIRSATGSAAGDDQALSFIAPLNPGTLTIKAFQNQGAAVNLNACYVFIVRIN